MKTLSSLTDEYDSRALTREPGVRPAAVVRPHQQGRRREFEKGDLIAVPLCILWGAVLWMSSYAPLARLTGLEGSGLSYLWSFPATAARYLFGW